MCDNTGVQLPAGAVSVTVGSHVYKGPPLPPPVTCSDILFSFLRLACIDFPPQSVATQITMASPSNTTIIADDEELLSLEPISSRPRKAPRRDYSY
jgi:hypothetical protein